MTEQIKEIINAIALSYGDEAIAEAENITVALVKEITETYYENIANQKKWLRESGEAA